MQGIIAARLDALAEDEKRLLQDAAVVGKVFWLGALAALDGATRRQADELLYGLERKEFVQRERAARRSRARASTPSATCSSATSPTARSRAPRAPTSTGARPAGSSRSDGRRTRPRCSRTTTSQALELAEASGAEATALGESARRALRDAGDRAASLYAVDAAERFYDAALRLWPEDDPERAELLFRRAASHGRLGRSIPSALARRETPCSLPANRAKAAEAEMLLSGVFWYRGLPDLADEHAAQAATMLAGAEPSRSTVLGPVTGWRRGRASPETTMRSLELASQALAHAEELGWEEGIGHALAPLGMARVEHGDERGIEDYERSIEIATAAGELGTLSHQLNNLSVAYQLMGDLDAGAEARLEAARIAERLGSARRSPLVRGHRDRGALPARRVGRGVADGGRLHRLRGSRLSALHRLPGRMPSAPRSGWGAASTPG